LKVLHNWLDYHLFSTTSDETVHIGIHGWLFNGQANPAPGAPTIDRQTGNRLFLDCHAVEKMITATGRRFLFTVIPGKAAMYPEFVGSGMPRTESPVYQALLKANTRHPLAGFIRLEPTLKKAKLNGIDVYHRQSLRWSCAGAAAAAEQILAVQEPDRLSTGSRSAPACPPPDNDLYRRLLGEDPHESICHWPAMSRVPTPSPGRQPWSTEMTISTVCSRLSPTPSTRYRSSMRPVSPHSAAM
jgi:hypothetical protein